MLRTYKSEKTIVETHERELYAYIMGIIDNLQCKLLRIGGMPDHIHIFASLSPLVSLSEFVQKVKANSSRWLKNNNDFPKWSGWSKEYAGFSYSKDDKENIVNYIKRQKEHHKVYTFSEEYRLFLIENGIQPDDILSHKDD